MMSNVNEYQSYKIFMLWMRINFILYIALYPKLYRKSYINTKIWKKKWRSIKLLVPPHPSHSISVVFVWKEYAPVELTWVCPSLPWQVNNIVQGRESLEIKPKTMNITFVLYYFQDSGSTGFVHHSFVNILYSFDNKTCGYTPLLLKKNIIGLELNK